MSLLNSYGSKSRLKKWRHLSDFHVSFLSYGPYIVKNCALFAIFSNVCKKSKAVIAIYVYASESSRFALLENGSGYYAMTLILEDNTV